MVKKESACSGGGQGSDPGSGRSHGEGNGYPLQYSCLENPMDRGAWRASVYMDGRVRHSEPLTLSLLRWLTLWGPLNKHKNLFLCFRSIVTR